MSILDSFRFSTYRRWRGIVEPRSLVENEVQDLVENEIQGLFGVIGLRESVRFLQVRPRQTKLLARQKLCKQVGQARPAQRHLNCHFSLEIKHDGSTQPAGWPARPGETQKMCKCRISRVIRIYFRSALPTSENEETLARNN